VPSIAFAIAGLAAGALLMLAFGRIGRAPKTEAPLRRFHIATQGRSQSGLAVSPDGRAIAFASGDKLWIREVDRLEPRLLSEDPGLHGPFWSPDSKSIGYMAGNRLMKVSLAGGDRQLISATSQEFTGGSGASWGEDGTITLSHAESDGLLRVSALGGDAKVILPADTTNESDLHDPSLLPNGRGVLFVAHRANSGPDNISLFAGGKRRVLLDMAGQVVGNPCYSPSGHILFSRAPDNRGIWALPFSLDRLQVTGAPFLVAANGVQPSVSNDGTLVYMPAEPGAAQYAWVDRTGREIAAIGQPVKGGATNPSLSRDGKRIAIWATENENADLWILDATRGTRTRLSFEPGAETLPEWSSDGMRIVYHALPKGTTAASQYAVLIRASDGSGAPDTLARHGIAPVLTPDDRYVVFTLPQGGSGDIPLFYCAVSGDHTSMPLIQGKGINIEGHVSPDGKYVAYGSTESGSVEVYLRHFPSGEGKWQVSNGGGTWPRWNARGDRLYYAHENDIMEVPVALGASPTLGQPQKLFTRAAITLPTIVGWPPGFDVAGDGSRFLIVREADSSEHQNGFVVVQNWAAEFRDKK
jgi:Tol biopolymer transport system component